MDEISSVAPGKKDATIIKSTDGSKTKVQKRYLVVTVREVYEQFKLAYPNEKIGGTSFSLLRPKHVLPTSDIPHNVCLCKYHTNVDLLLLSLSRILNTPKTTSRFREAIVCDSNDETCMASQCEHCGNLKHFDALFQCNGQVGGQDLTYHQWKTIDSKIVKVEKNRYRPTSNQRIEKSNFNFPYAHFSYSCSICAFRRMQSKCNCIIDCYTS